MEKSREGRRERKFFSQALVTLCGLRSTPEVWPKPDECHRGTKARIGSRTGLLRLEKKSKSSRMAIRVTHENLHRRRQPQLLIPCIGRPAQGTSPGASAQASISSAQSTPASLQEPSGITGGTAMPDGIMRLANAVQYGSKRDGDVRMHSFKKQHPQAHLRALTTPPGASNR